MWVAKGNIPIKKYCSFRNSNLVFIKWMYVFIVIFLNFQRKSKSIHHSFRRIWGRKNSQRQICYAIFCNCWGYLVWVPSWKEGRQYYLINYYQKCFILLSNCSDLLWEEIVLLIEKNFWNLRLKAGNLQNFEITKCQ